MEFTEWIQMGVQEQFEFLQNASDKEILMFITHLCSVNIKKSKTIIRYIEINRMLRIKFNSIPDLEHVKDSAMKEMCKLCKADMEDEQ